MTIYEMHLLSPTEAPPTGSMATWLGFDVEMKPEDILEQLLYGAH
jgi:hypothetical protein